MLGKIADALGKVFGIVDDVVTSDEERMALKAPLMQIQAQVLTEIIAAEKALVESQAKVITAEAAADSWLTRSWRPIAMLAFVAMLLLSWFGVGPTPPEELWTTVNLGLGGYIGGRTLEKALPAMAEVFNRPTEK